MYTYARNTLAQKEWTTMAYIWKEFLRKLCFLLDRHMLNVAWQNLSTRKQSSRL